MSSQRIISITVFFFTCIISNQLYAYQHCRSSAPLQEDHVEKFYNPFYASIWDYNRRLFPSNSFNWEAHTFREYTAHVLRRSLEPPKGVKRMRAFDLVASINSPELPQQESTIINQGTWRDLNFFVGEQNKEAYLAQYIDLTHTELGRVILYGMLAHPINNVDGPDGLKARQGILQEFMRNKELSTQLETIFTSLQKPENVMLSFYSETSFERSVQPYGFIVPMLKRFNTSPFMLQVNHIIGTSLMERALNLALNIFGAVVVPLYSLSVLLGSKINLQDDRLEQQAKRQSTLGGEGIQFLSMIVDTRNEKTLAFLGLASGLYYLLYLERNKEWISDDIFFEECLQTQMIEVRAYFEGMYKVQKLISQYPSLKKSLPLFHHLETLMTQTPQTMTQLKTLFSLLRTQTFTGQPSLFSLHGHILAAFNLIMKIKDNFRLALAAMGQIDAYASTAKLVETSQNTRVRYSFVEFLDSPTPRIELTNVCNPFVDRNKVIPMSISLGDNYKQNGIISGPNAGGKSTMLKAIAIALITGQVFGIALAERAAFTPFSLIATYLNIRDDIGVGNSLFKAEVIHACQLLTKIKRLQPGEFSATFADEIFKGTAAKEGSAAGYSFGLSISQLPQSICMLATHFPLLTTLELTTDSFANYKVQVNVDPLTGAISYPFTLTPGVSDQNCAIAILQSEGFDNELLHIAEQIVAGTYVPGS